MRLTAVHKLSWTGIRQITADTLNVIRKLVAATALLALLLYCCEVGEACEAWQNHQCDTSSSCPICHLSQQAVTSAVSAQPVIKPERLGSLPKTQDPPFIAISVSTQFGTRAPPFA
jgi:hypothetical protein